MATSLVKSDVTHNPLDIAEWVIMDRDWVFDRPAEGELIAEVNGVWCNYRMWFTWQEEYEGLTLNCTMDGKLPKNTIQRVHTLLALINEKMWMGFFSLSSEENTISFRHTHQLHDGITTSAEQLTNLLDLAISECDRFYPAIQAVVWGGKGPAEAIEIAMFETVAEA